MKTLSALAALAFLLPGCADSPFHPSAQDTSMHTQGTANGASFQGVNQGTNSTDATRSSDTPR